MFRRACLGILPLLGLLASGCETLSLKEFTPVEDGPKTAFIDIKQRAVLSGKPAGASNPSAALVFCAEPSPDAISSLATEFAADAKYKDALAATLGFSQQEAASFVGLRTQTIQLLRDGMFRLCEGYLGGALSPSDFAWLSRRYQRNMVALLTIEQLTRVAQLPTIGQASQGMASAARSAAAIQGDLEALDKDLTRLKDEKARIDADKAESDKLTDGDEKTRKLQDIQGRLDNNTAASQRVGELRAALLEGLKTARGVLVNGSTSVQVLAAHADTRGHVSDVVAKEIAGIAKKVLDQDDLNTLCFQLLSGERQAKTADGRAVDNSSLIAACQDRIRNAGLDTKSSDPRTPDQLDANAADNDGGANGGPQFLSKKLSPEVAEQLEKLLNGGRRFQALPDGKRGAPADK